MRGGIAIALAFSVPKYMYGDKFVSIIYIVVLFLIVVQGLTLDRLAKKFREKDELKYSIASRHQINPF